MSLGLKTVDAEVRQIMNKKTSLKHYIKTNRIMNNADVEVLNSAMLGLPGERKQIVGKHFQFWSDNKEIKQANLAMAVP